MILAHVGEVTKQPLSSGFLKKALSNEQPSVPMHQNYLLPTALAIIIELKPIPGVGSTGGHSATRSASTHECLCRRIPSKRSNFLKRFKRGWYWQSQPFKQTCKYTLFLSVLALSIVLYHSGKGAFWRFRKPIIFQDKFRLMEHFESLLIPESLWGSKGLSPFFQWKD